jgi:hypothetical protein
MPPGPALMRLTRVGCMRLEIGRLHSTEKSAIFILF